MKIVQSDEIESSKASLHREGAAYRKLLLEGEAGIDNFSLVISRSEARFSPRHRHTFEQFRYQLEGTADYSKTGTLEAGMLGYFPEAVHYGPQTQVDKKDLTVLCLQCGGASGDGYIGRGEQLEAAKELQSMGTFKDGVFHRNPDLPGKRNVEGSRAIWEHIKQRPLEYSEPRYETPFLMKPDNFDWRPVKGVGGVYEKHMGVFTERNSASGFVKLDSDISYNLGTDGRDIYFVLKGAGTAIGEPYRWGTTFYLEPNEVIALTAVDETEMIHFRLPELDDLKAREMVAELS
ncbi:hypothetical protein N9452_08515 [Alphaproteobacteria bacterium]|nr:hypothetical protein [Alphaproteobacteria bacterium]